LLKSEYGLDLLTGPSLTDFISQYVEGVFQSGILEMLYAAQTDKRHFVIVSTVSGESWSAVTAIFPCYKGCAKDTKLSILKAGVITMEQLKTPMILFSHGALVNPHVLGRQLTHFAPVTVPDEVQEKDLLNQCCIFLDPNSELNSEQSRLQHSMEITTETFDRLQLVQAEMHLADRPLKIEQLLQRRQQKIIFYLFAAWVDEVDIANDFLLKAEEHGTMQRNRQNASILKLSLREWNAIHLFSKSVRTFSAKLVMHNIDTVIRACFDNWKYSRYNKKRVQRQFCMHNVKTVIDKTTLTNIFRLWQVSRQVTRMQEKER